MLYRRRLRSRIVLSFLVFGTLLSALFAFSTLVLLEIVEDELIGETIAQETLATRLELVDTLGEGGALAAVEVDGHALGLRVVVAS